VCPLPQGVPTAPGCAHCPRVCPLPQGVPTAPGCAHCQLLIVYASGRWATLQQDTNLSVAVCLLLSLCRDKPGCALSAVQVNVTDEWSEELYSQGRDCLAPAHIAAGSASLGCSS
jgi:hypothetical protein